MISDDTEGSPTGNLDCGPEAREAARAGILVWAVMRGRILPSEAVFAKFGKSTRSAKTELHEMPRENLTHPEKLKS